MGRFTYRVMCGSGVDETHVAMHAGKPALFQFLQEGRFGGLFPECRNEGFALFVQGQGLECVFYITWEPCIDERIFSMDGL